MGSSLLEHPGASRFKPCSAHLLTCDVAVDVDDLGRGGGRGAGVEGHALADVVVDRVRGRLPLEGSPHQRVRHRSVVRVLKQGGRSVAS